VGFQPWELTGQSEQSKQCRQKKKLLSTTFLSHIQPLKQESPELS
jgi:hypothetical protein